MTDNRGATAHLASALRSAPSGSSERLIQWSVSYDVDLLKHALGPEPLFDRDFSVGRDLLAMPAFVVLALTVACRRFSQAPVLESLARIFTVPKRH